MRARLVLLVMALAAMGVTLVIAYGDRVAVGVRVAGIELGGRTASDARAELLARTADARITVAADGTAFVLDPGSGIDVDIDAALARAAAVGREGDLWNRGAQIARAAAFGIDVGLPRRITDAERLARTVELVAATVERDVVDAGVAIEGGTVLLRAASEGRSVDRAALVDGLLGARAIDATVVLPVRALAPSLGDDAVADAYEAASNASIPLVLVAGSERTALDPSRLLPLVRVTRDGGERGDTLVLSLDDVGLDQLVADIATALDGPVREADLLPGEARLAVVPGRDGVTVDRAATRAFLLDAVFASERVVDVPARVTHPSLTTQAAQRVADTTVLTGGYTTYFPVNWARATNIGAAARTFDGMTVAPGASFSFWARLGEVSPRTGYVFAGTIINGVSSEAIGGGLCQVSTTFFNAVARGGYAIDERHPHSYYIERYPLGLDAAVFAPSTDMRWTNDTPHPALIRASATDTSVSFWIYSAPNGRTTTFTDPLQWNVRWPSADQPADPGHVPGYSVAGRDTSVARTVTENGTVVHEDVWYSHYAPVWGGPAR